MQVAIPLDWTMLAVRMPTGFVDEPGRYEVELAPTAHDPRAETITVDRR